MSQLPPELPPSKKNDTNYGLKTDTENSDDKFRFDWGMWGIGGRVIFVAACVASVSVFMKWVDIGFAKADGWSQGTFMLIGVFVYPMLRLLKGKPINLAGGLVCAGIGALGSLIFMARTCVTLGEKTAYLFGAGPVFFLLSSLALGYGIHKYQTR